MTTPSTILLVEDDGALRTLTARALRQSGFNVLTAATGA
jgi:DNA-binding response OmpR family regulator